MKKITIDIPTEEVWVRQVYEASTVDILNAFMKKAAFTDSMRNINIIPVGTRLVAVYEKKVSNEENTE